MARSARKPMVAICILSSIALAAFACSGVDSDLFSGTPSDAGDVTDANSDARTTTRDSGKSDAGSDAGGGGGGSDSGGGGGGGGGSIVPALCGDTLACTSSDPTCCATQTNNGITTTSGYSCTPSTTSCNASGDAPISCRDNNDCGWGSPICCGELIDFTGQGGYRRVSCESSCEATYSDGGVTPHVPFCSDGTPNACTSSGFMCMASAVLPGFNVCGQD